MELEPLDIGQTMCVTSCASEGFLLKVYHAISERAKASLER